MALTPEEKRLAQAVFHQGPALLFEEGWSRDRIAEFSQNADVQDVWQLLKREFDIHEGLRARGKFIAIRNLNRLIDPASAVLAQALAGPEYVRDKNGTIQRDAQGRAMTVEAEMTPTQLRAAAFVLEGAGLHDHRILGDPASDPSLKLLFAASDEDKTEVEDDPLAQTDEARALSRERVRNAITRLAPRIIDVRAKVKQVTGVDPATDTSVAKLKKVRAKDLEEKKTRAKESLHRGRKAR